MCKYTGKNECMCIYLVLGFSISVRTKNMFPTNLYKLYIYLGAHSQLSLVELNVFA